MSVLDFPRGIELAGTERKLLDRSGNWRGAVVYEDLGVLWRPRGSASIYHRRYVPEGTGEIREVCSYEFDRAMGLGYVPMTIWRQHDGTFGSLQRWLPNTFEEWKPATPDNDRESGKPSWDTLGEQRAIELWTLDAVLMNVDSVWTNYLWSEEAQAAARVDNCECLPPPEAVNAARSLPREHPADGYNWPLPWWRGLLHNLPIPTSLLARLSALDWNPLKKAWQDIGLEPDAADAAEERARAILRLGRVDTEEVWGLRDPH